MALKIFNLIFSLLSLPFGLFCSSWLFNRVLIRAQMTPREFMTNEYLRNETGRYLSDSPNSRRNRTQIIINFLTQKIGDNEFVSKSLHAYSLVSLISTIPLPLAIYGSLASSEKHVYIAIIGNVIIIIFDLIMLACRKKYYNDNPTDERTQEILNEKKRTEKENARERRTKDIIVYGLVILFFASVITVPLIFVIQSTPLNNVTNTPIYESERQDNIANYDTTNKLSHDKMKAILDDNSFTTNEIPVTYWQIYENDLMYVCAGIKGDTKVEYYGYSQDINTNLIFDEMANTICDNENWEYDQSYTQSSDGAKVVEIEKDDKYSVIINKDNSIIYAYSTQKDGDITTVLSQAGINI